MNEAAVQASLTSTTTTTTTTIMSQSSVARRCRRSVESLTLEDGSLGEADEELYASTPKQKRRRLDVEDEGEQEISDISEDGAGSPEGSLLPDSYRRSPKGEGKGKGPARPAGVHQPGVSVQVPLPTRDRS